MTEIVVEQVGPSVTIQDLGRPGWWSAGVGRSGAADRDAFRLANRIVGNPESSAALEVVLGGLVVRAMQPVLVAVTGAPAQATVDEIPVGHAAVLELSAGARLGVAMAEVGLRTYVAIRGGIAVAPVLGSRSRDTLAGIGPEPVSAGTVLPIGDPPGTWPRLDVVPTARPNGETVGVSVIFGPRADWFSRPEVLCDGVWRTSAQLDRVGVRLDRAEGPMLEPNGSLELPSEGMVSGAIQVPPDGRPVIFLADHPLTGGYPVVACVVAAEVCRVAQLRPGQLIAFRPRRSAFG